MIIGIGIDIVNITRIEKTIDKYGEKFKLRCFSKNEIDSSEKKIKPANSYAKKFAAKEAFTKAIGTGFARGVFWKDITVQNDIYGKPTIQLHGTTENYLKKKIKSKKYNIYLSLSDDKPWAHATVIITYN